MQYLIAFRLKGQQEASYVATSRHPQLLNTIHKSGQLVESRQTQNLIQSLELILHGHHGQLGSKPRGHGHRARRAYG
jgi:uncharacterized membrane protein